jgi:hypothetical protein
MWEIYINNERVRELCSKHNYDLGQVTLTVGASVIRDGTSGISLTMANDILGEWTDSKARSLELAQDYKVIVRKANGDALYALIAPERVVDGEQISDTQVSLILEL